MTFPRSLPLPAQLSSGQEHMTPLAARLLLARLEAEGAHLTPDSVARMRAGWADLEPDVRAEREADLALAARQDAIAAVLVVVELLEDLQRAQ